MDIDVYVYACVYREREQKKMNLCVYIPFSYGLPCGDFFHPVPVIKKCFEMSLATNFHIIIPWIAIAVLGVLVRASPVPMVPMVLVMQLSK